MSFRELDTAGGNDYDLNGGHGPAVTMRSPASLLSAQSSRVRGSFIRKLTDDFIIPVMNLTLLVKIGEGMIVCTPRCLCDSCLP